MKYLKKFLKRLGPGFISGAADDDPSGIATYAQTGALFGYSQLWLALFSTPFIVILQEMTARIGLTTGKGLSAVIRENYSKKILYLAVFLILIVNSVNIGADLGAMAASAQLLINIPFAALLISMTALTLLLEIFLTYKTYVKFLKYLTISLFAYVVTAFFVKQDWAGVFRATLIPHLSLSKDYLLNITAVLGTTISPYLFFWQADEEIEEERTRHKNLSIAKEESVRAERDLSNMRWDTSIGMIFSNLITFFIILTAASTLGRYGIRNIGTASEAAQALRPLAGPLTSLLFAAGILGVGLLAVPVLAGSASYAMAEAFGWRAGLYKKFKRAHGFYGIITFATLIGLLINFTPIKPFQMLYYTAILTGIVSPPLMFILIRTASDKKIMGRQASRPIISALGWIITGAMSLALIALIANFIL